MKLYRLSFQVKLFISFAVLTIIPLLIISIVSDRLLLQFAKEELNQSHLRNLEVAEQILQMWNEEAVKHSINIVNQASLNELVNYPSLDSVIRTPAAMAVTEEVIKSLNKIVSLNSKYSSATLYLTDSEYIITSQSGVVMKSEYADEKWMQEFVVQNNVEIPQTLWRDTREARLRDGNAMRGDMVMSFLYPIAPYISEINGFIIINIKEPSLSGIINGGNGAGEDHIQIFNQAGIVVSSVNTPQIGALTMDEALLRSIVDSQAKTAAIETGNEVTVFYHSAINDWLLTSSYSMETLVYQINQQHLRVISIALILAAAGVILAFVVARNLYRPILSLTKKVSAYHPKSAYRNEFGFLSESFESIITQVKNGKQSSVGNSLSKLLYGVDDAEALNLPAFPHQLFCCAVAHLDNKPTQDSQLQRVLFDVVVNSLKAALSGQAICEGIYTNTGTITLVLNYNAEKYTAIRQLLMKAQGAFQEQYGTSFSVGMGLQYDNSGELYRSYKQAEQALQLRFFEGKNTMLTYQKDAREYEYYYPIDCEMAIENNLLLGRADAIHETVSNLVAELRENRNISVDNAFQIFYQMLGLVIKYLVQQHVSTTKIWGDNGNPYQLLAACETLDEIECFILHVFQNVVEVCNLDLNQAYKRVDKIKLYIQDHFHEDIDLATLADYVGLSISHMRRIFAEETGENIIYYINQLRVRTAKVLLADTNKTITEIAAEVGYVTKQSFNRFFKKYEGITPSEFRNINRK